MVALNVKFSMTSEAFEKATFFRPASDEVGITKLSDGIMKIPKKL